MKKKILQYRVKKDQFPMNKEINCYICCAHMRYK